MFHAVSKLLFVFTTPIFWVTVLFTGAIFARKAALKKKFLVAGCITFYLFTNSFVFDEVVGKWEPKMNRVEEDKHYELAVVLGGYSTFAPGVGQVNFSESSDRVLQVLPLYKNKQVEKILLSGGPGNLFDYSEPEASYTAHFLKSIGIKKKDILIEPQSRNTFQNAVHAKKIIDSLRIETPILLITSTTHMPRASACFDKQGIVHDKYLVDGIVGERKFYFDHLFVPNARVIFMWNVIIHEWLGLLVYKVSGYI